MSRRMGMEGRQKRGMRGEEWRIQVRKKVVCKNGIFAFKTTVNHVLLPPGGRVCMAGPSGLVSPVEGMPV